MASKNFKTLRSYGDTVNNLENFDTIVMGARRVGDSIFLGCMPNYVMHKTEIHILIVI